MTEVGFTKSDLSFPGYVNVRREGDEYVLTVRGDPVQTLGSCACGVDCLPNGPMCNNYCNIAPGKGPMAPATKQKVHTKDAPTAQLRLSGDQLARFLADLQPVMAG